MQGLHTGQEGRRELGKTGGALHCLSPEVTCVTSRNRQLTRTRHGVVNCLWTGETEMPVFAERKGDQTEYSTGGPDEGLVDFPIATEASSFESQWIQECGQG